jgi:Bacterial PH domain
MTFQRRVGLSAVARYLLPHEEEIFAARSHPASLLQPFVLALGGILAAIAVTMAGHDPRLARLLAWILVIFLLFRLLFLTGTWSVQVVALTNTRLMLISGFFNVRVTSFDVQDLRYCTFERSFGGRLLGYGTIIFDAAGRNRTLVEFLPYPEQIYLVINGILSPGSLNPPLDTGGED